ncbi:Rho GTPase-activating protein 1 [Dionaea muscipula]
MAVVAHSSSPSCTRRSPTTHDGLYQLSSSLASVDDRDIEGGEEEVLGIEEERGGERKRQRQRESEGGGGGGGGDQLSLLAVFGVVVRKSVFGCKNWSESEELTSSSVPPPICTKMEIGIPTNVRHVAHVTFDRFHGFLGLPVEFEPEVPRRAPSASATVFGVSTNSMQLSFDSRGNSVPTILLLMQHRLYALGGLEVEGIFRIDAGNGQEEYVRDQLNRGVVPDDADVHCLAGLIKTWFRELPVGLLDCLSPELLIQCHTEEECARLARLLPSTEAALLDWAINLMADVAHHEHLNKMNLRNVAVVFAPNMTHVLDPLTALMHAVQVMNFLKNLISRTLREREDSALGAAAAAASRSGKDPWDDDDDENGHCGCLHTILEEANEVGDDESNQEADISSSSEEDKGLGALLTAIENTIPRDHKTAKANGMTDELSGGNREAQGVGHC